MNGDRVDSSRSGERGETAFSPSPRSSVGQLTLRTRHARYGVAAVFFVNGATFDDRA